MLVIPEELQQVLKQLLLPQRPRIHRTPANVLINFLCPSCWRVKQKDKLPWPTRASVSRRNQNSTCSVAGGIWRLGSVWDGIDLVWILPQHHLRPAGLLDYISCIDMVPDTLLHGVCYLLLESITSRWQWVRCQLRMEDLQNLRPNCTSLQNPGMLRASWSSWMIGMFYYIEARMAMPIHVIHQDLQAGWRTYEWFIVYSSLSVF